jgi:probable rRNA maturation factor
MIGINNLTGFKVNEKFLIKVAEDVLRAEKACEECELSVVLVSLEKMKELNGKFRGKDEATDVLSFECCDDGIKKEGLEIRPLGEVVICPAYVEEQGKENGNSLEKELSFVLIHGILHLLGYDHEKGGAEEKIMQEKQECYLCRSFK